MALANPSILFKTAAYLYGLAAPAHIKFLGFDTVYPALKKIPLVGKNTVGQRGAENCWNYVAVSLAIAACLNWQWARTGGPQTTEESIIFWAIAGIHGLNGARYLQVGAYPTLAPMWLGPAISIAAIRSL